jgi:hypothetical protein
MKKILASLIAISMLATPAMAEHRNRDRDNYSHGEKRRGGGCGWLCGAIIGGVVVGALSSKRTEEREQEYDNRYYPPDYRYDRRYCVREQIVEWRYGERYIYWQTTCN